MLFELGLPSYDTVIIASVVSNIVFRVNSDVAAVLGSLIIV